MRQPGLVYTSPKSFSTRQKIVLAIFPPIVGRTLRLIGSTCRIERRGEDHLQRVLDEHGQAIVSFWHEVLGLAGYYYRDTGWHTLTSYSFDGEMAARSIEPLGLHAVRGSSSRGGSEALQQLELALNLVNVIGFTVDGPKGPRREAKPGIAILAARTRVPIVPVALAATKSWRLNSWDRFIVPKPFGRIHHVYAPPIPPPPSEHESDVEATRVEVQGSMNRLHRDLESSLGQPLFDPCSDFGPSRD